jgi:hypothetical protein
MTVQTTYSIDHNVAYAGMVFTLQPWNGVSRLNKGTAVIPYGKGVVTDGEDGSKLPTAASTAAEYNGVVMYELNRAQQDGNVAGGVPGQDMTVVPFGAVYVKVLDTVVKDAPVYLRVGATNPGDFSGIVGSGATLGVLLPGVKFLTGGAAGQLVLISQNIGG